MDYIENKNELWGWGMGDGALGIGDGALPPNPNHQSPIPNPQSPFKITNLCLNKIRLKIFYYKKKN